MIHGSPVSRETILRNEEEKECIFKPRLGRETKILAKKIKSKRPEKEIARSLYEDFREREFRKKVIEQTVNF